MNGAPKPYHWVEYKNDAGEPAARCMRVFDATLWQIWMPYNNPLTTGQTGCWSSPVVVRDIPETKSPSAEQTEKHMEMHVKLEAGLREVKSELGMIADIVDHLGERSSFQPDDFKPRLRDRLSAAFAAWQEGQH